MDSFLDWLLTGALGPAAFVLPVNWAASMLTDKARRWRRGLNRNNELARLVREAVQGEAELSDAEGAAVLDLLADAATWEQVRNGTVEDLAVRVARQLPARDQARALVIGRAISAAFLQYVLKDREPELFRQSMLARLDRIEARTESGLDRVLFTRDVAALLARKDAMDEDRFTDLVDRLSLLVKRLPPGPAGPGEVAVYLARLVHWLDADPWLQGQRAGGPPLAPSQIERKLRITGSQDIEDQDADELSDHCTRLVILGGPGTGKTWLAKRAARRCALAAMARLADGASLDEVELPLYTTCARLVAMPPGDGMRTAVIGAALDQIPDLAGKRSHEAVRALFEDREAPTLLVLDSLDEARDAEDQVRLADTLPLGWRVLLTSRHASWDGQLDIGSDDRSRVIGELQPLRYPDDVEPFILEWFSADPAKGRELAAQLRNRQALQETATVPLILAFYCIVGDGRPLPERRAELYSKVIRRMLTGRWRRSSNRELDLGACVYTLRKWAWSGAASHPISGVGIWEDEFPVPLVSLRQEVRLSLDHVAVPTGPQDLDTQDLDTEMTNRRFVHRTIREHLVSAHIASEMSATEAAGKLLHHLWYDPDWEWAAPAALALHPRRDQVLMRIIRSVTNGGQSHADVAAIDSCMEIRQFLAKVATESRETDWSPEAAELIGEARRHIATSWRYGDFPEIVARDWPTSNARILKWLLRMLAKESSPKRRRELSNAIVRLAITEEERACARDSLIKLARETDLWQTKKLPGVIVRLAVTGQERVQTCEDLLELLDSQTDPWKARLFAEAVGMLAPTARDRERVMDVMIGLLDAETDAWAAQALAETIAGLNPSAEHQARARGSLLALLEGETDPKKEKGLRGAVATLTPAPGSLRNEKGATQTPPMQSAAGSIRRNSEAGPEFTVGADSQKQVHALVSSDNDRRRAQVAWSIVAGENGEGQTRVRVALLKRMANEDNDYAAGSMARVVADLNPTREEIAFVRKLLVDRIIERRRGAYDVLSSELPETVVRLAATEDELGRPRELLLDALSSEADPREASMLARIIAALSPTAEDQFRVRELLLNLLDKRHNATRASSLAYALGQLDPSAEERARARGILLNLLGDELRAYYASDLAGSIIRLDPTAEERVRARTILLKLHNGGSWSLAQEIVDLGVTVADLTGLPRDGALFETPGGGVVGGQTLILSAARRNSELSAWISALPVLFGASS